MKFTSATVATLVDPWTLVTVDQKCDGALLIHALINFCGVPLASAAHYRNSNIVRALDNAGVNGFFKHFITLKEEVFATAV